MLVTNELCCFCFTQLALLAYINGDPRGKDLYNATVGVNLALNLHKKFKPVNKSDALRVRFDFVV